MYVNIDIAMSHLVTMVTGPYSLYSQSYRFFFVSLYCTQCLFTVLAEVRYRLYLFIIRSLESILIAGTFYSIHVAPTLTEKLMVQCFVYLSLCGIHALCCTSKKMCCLKKANS